MLVPEYQEVKLTNLVELTELNELQSKQKGPNPEVPSQFLLTPYSGKILIDVNGRND